MLLSRMVASLSNQLTQGSQSQPTAPGSSGASGASLSQVGESTVEAALAVQAVRNACSRQLEGVIFVDIVVGKRGTHDGSLALLLCDDFCLSVSMTNGRASGDVSYLCCAVPVLRCAAVEKGIVMCVHARCSLQLLQGVVPAECV